MNKRTVFSLSLFILCLTSACRLTGRAPTPIPFVTPQATAHISDEPTATPRSATATPVPTALPATLRPTESPATATPTLPKPEITLTMPQPSVTVGHPLIVQGSITQMPFEGTLVVRVYDAWNQLAAEMPITAPGDYGGPASFEASIAYGGVPGRGRVEVVELSSKDGSVVAEAQVDVVLTPFPGGAYIESPPPLARVTLPLRMLARVGTVGQQVNVTVTWLESGTQFSRLETALAGLDGRGLVLVALSWPNTAQFDSMPTQPAQIQVHDLEGALLAQQFVTMLNPSSAETMGTQVFWVKGDEIVAETIRVPRTLGIGRASLEALLWGPVPGNADTYTSAIPSPQAVLDFQMRGENWGERVKLQDVYIKDAVAYADFSSELLAFSGGATQVLLIREQIERTLLQFSTVDEVIITVNEHVDKLEP